MSKIFEDNSQTIGHTPLVRLKHFGNGNILACLLYTSDAADDSVYV